MLLSGQRLLSILLNHYWWQSFFTLVHFELVFRNQGTFLLLQMQLLALLNKLVRQAYVIPLGAEFWFEVALKLLSDFAVLLVLHMELIHHTIYCETA